MSGKFKVFWKIGLLFQVAKINKFESNFKLFKNKN